MSTATRARQPQAPKTKPAPKPAARRAPARTPATGRTSAPKPPAKKASARKAPAKETAARKAPTKAASGRKAPGKETAARKAPAGKAAAKKAAPERASAAKPTPRKATAARKATKRPATKKPARKAKATRKPAGRRAPDLTTAAGYQRFAGVPRPEPARVAAILELLEDHYDAVCALDHRTPFQLLVATILSAQCTDEMVNKVTPALFARYPDAPALAEADQADVEALVRRTGFYRNKAKNIIGAARRVRELGGELPREMDTFLTIPGAARKTANVVMGTAFGLTTGVVVDTHVMRLTRRWGFHALKDAVKVEKVLQAILPREKWVGFSHRTIWHGRTLCQAKSPQCDECPILPYCPEGQALMGHG